MGSFSRASRPRPGLVLAALLLLAASASAAPEGRPRRIPWLGSWADHDPDRPAAGAEPWQPADVANMLAAWPEAVVDLGIHEGLPAGNRHWQRRAAQRAAARTTAASLGVDVGSRMCMRFRPDVFRKLAWNADSCVPSVGGGGCDWEGDMDGRFGETETVVKRAGRASAGDAQHLVDDEAAWPPEAWLHRLLVLRPGTSLEERRRIVLSGTNTLGVGQPWQVPPRAGDRYEIRGSFDPSWVVRVSRETHEASVDRFWAKLRNVCGRSGKEPCRPPAEPLDPLSRANRRAWKTAIDREAIEALADATRVPALYGLNRDADPDAPPWTDPFLSVTAVVMDLRNQAYRDWSIRYLLYKLQDHGFEPGEPACILFAYKPGFHTAYDAATEGPSTHVCALPDTGSWAAPAHVCTTGGQQGGPLNPTPYGPGEYEAALSAYLREMLPTLASHGYGDVQVITVERPLHRGRKWTILDADLRWHRQLVGELGSAIEPRLADVPRLRPAAAPPAATAGAPPAPPDAAPLPAAPAPPAERSDLAGVPAPPTGDPIAGTRGAIQSRRQEGSDSAGGGVAPRRPAERAESSAGGASSRPTPVAELRGSSPRPRPTPQAESDAAARSPRPAPTPSAVGSSRARSAGRTERIRPETRPVERPGR